MKHLSLLCVALATVACTRTDDARTEFAIAAAPAIGPQAAPMSIEAPVGTLERRILDLKACSLEGHQIMSTCPAMETLAHVLAQPGASRELSLALGHRLLANPSPAVRLETAKLMGRDIGSREAIVDATRRETDLGVRRALLRVVANDGATSAQVAGLLLASTVHPDAGVRLEAVTALSAPANRGLVGGADRLASLAETDPDPSVRQEACALAGKLGAPGLVAMYERTTASSSDAAMYAACMEGLVAMFHNHPSFDTSSEAAYRLFLRRVSATPRTATSPPWSVMSTFCYYSHGADAEKLAAWKRNAPWFDATEAKRVMTGVITDGAASWEARTAAVESMVGLGASKAELHALLASVGGKAPSDTHVRDKLASVVAE